jgi:hypothetical protein
MAVAGVVLAPASHAAPASSGTATLNIAKLSESCSIPAFAFAHYAIKSGHAVSGTWTLQPRIVCDQPKTRLTISATLKRNGAPQFSSSGECRATGLHFCTTAAGPKRSKAYLTSIRGTWTATVQYTLAGIDAVYFAKRSPTAGTCHFDAPKLAVACHYDTAPVVIR